MDVSKKPKIVFDIVNSVKGGSGKSTIALQLAAYWAFQSNIDAYVIDLDLRGTSWKKTYENNFINSYNQYINELLYGFDTEDTVFWSLNVERTSTVDPKNNISATIRLCIADPEISSDIDAVKVDLLENTVFEIVQRIISKSQEKDEVHIIFDMPPSYESHAERVVKHLLMDKRSKLYTENQENGKCAYHINLLMVYAITRAHVEQNIVYVKNFLKTTAYSSSLNLLIANHNFSLYFVGNDVTNVINSKDEHFNNIISKIRDTVKVLLSEAIPSDTITEFFTNMADKLFVIPHMGLDRNLEFFLGEKMDKKPKLMDEAELVFTSLFGREIKV